MPAIVEEEEEEEAEEEEEEEEEESFPKCYFKKRSLIVYSCVALRK